MNLKRQTPLSKLIKVSSMQILQNGKKTSFYCCFIGSNNCLILYNLSVLWILFAAKCRVWSNRNKSVLREKGPKVLSGNYWFGWLIILWWFFSIELVNIFISKNILICNMTVPAHFCNFEFELVFSLIWFAYPFTPSTIMFKTSK